MTDLHCSGVDPCPACESLAEDRAAAQHEIERADPWGRTADWHFPRGLAPRGL